MKQKQLPILLLVLVLTFALLGCGTATPDGKVHLESGVIDADYEGIPDPKLIVKMKLTPAEEQGIFEKVPVVTSLDKAELEAEMEDELDVFEVEESSTPRPKI